MIKESDSRLLNKLVSDCITYNLKEAEALKYIEIEFGRPFSRDAYYRRRAYVNGEGHTHAWLNHFTKIGFVQHHRKLLDDLDKIQTDRLKAFFVEANKSFAERDESKLSTLNHDIRENSKLLSEFGLGTPVISAIKAKLDAIKQQEQQQGIKEGIQVSQ